MPLLSLLLLIAAVVVLVLAALNVTTSRVSLLSAGLALWAASELAVRLA